MNTIEQETLIDEETGESSIIYKVDKLYGDVTFSSREDAEKFIDDQMKIFSAYIEEVNNVN